MNVYMTSLQGFMKIAYVSKAHAEESTILLKLYFL